MRENQQNILEKINIRWNRFYGKLQSSKMSFGINKEYLAPIAPGIVTVMLTLIDHKTENSTSEYHNFALNLFFIVTVGTFIYVTYHAIHTYRIATNHYQVISDSFYKQKVLSQLKLSPRQKNSGYEIREFDSGTSKESYLISEMVNHRLIKKQLAKQEIDLDLVKPRFSLAMELKNSSPVFYDVASSRIEFFSMENC